MKVREHSHSLAKGNFLTVPFQSKESQARSTVGNNEYEQQEGERVRGTGNN